MKIRFTAANSPSNKRLRDITIEGIGSSVPATVCLFESFETGLPTSYEANTSFTLSSGVWTGTANQIIRGTQGVESGSFSLQLRSQTGASIISPELPNGIETLSFYVTSSTTSGAYQINISEDNGVTWSAAPGSPFSISTYKQFNSIDINNANVNRFEIRRTGATLYFDDVEVLCFQTVTTAPKIQVKGNNQVIANGSNSPLIDNNTDFGNAEANSGSQVKTFVIENIGDDDLLLNGSPTINITGSHASDFSVSSLPSTTIADGDNSSFQITFDPSNLGLRTATVTIESNDPNNGTFTFDIQGTGTNSSSSDIIENSSFTYTSNINYAAYQNATITNTSHSVGVFQFIIRDGGGSNDVDALSTELNAITFDVDNIENIRSAALFDGNALVNNSSNINFGSQTISFTGLSGAAVTANDNNSKTLTLRVTFLSDVTDNEQLQFTVSSATANSAGSVFSTANAGGSNSSITGDRNRIEVIADRLNFAQQPTSTNLSTAMSPAVTVEAIDINNNRDLDFTNNISITSSGTLTGSPVTSAAVNGLATFSNLIHTVAENDINLTASSGAFSTVDSDNFDITLFVFLSGDVRPKFDFADLSFGGTSPYYWEEFNGSTWVNRSASPQASKPSRIIINKEGIGGAGNSSNTYNDIVILSGGSLILDNTANPSVDFIAANKTLEIQDGGTLEVNGQIDINATANLIVREGGTIILNNSSIDNQHGFWDGVENFEAGSTIKITNWRFAASPTARSIINVINRITDNTNGYKFGNLILDVNATDGWTLVGGPVGVVDLCENNLEITNSSSNYVGGATNSTGTNGFTINGDLIINDGPFNFGTSFSTGTFNHQFIINGDFICNTDDALKIHRNGNNTATTLNGKVVFKVNITVGENVAEFTNDNSSGGSRMTVEIEGGKDSIPLEINIAPVATAFDITLKSGSFATLKGNDLTINSLTSNTTTFTVESDASFNFGFNDSIPLVVKRPGYLMVL